MTQIPLPKTITGLKSTPKRQEHLINLFNSEGALIRPPGIDLLSTESEIICRGSGRWYVDGNAYLVIGSALYQIDVTDQVTNIGAITGTDFQQCHFSIGQTDLVIVVDDGDGYIYDENGLNQITSPNYLRSRSVDFIDGRHVFIPADGSPAFYTEVDQPNNILSTNFFDAEELPDLNRVVINVNNDLHIGGSEAFERYRPTGNVDAPFQKRVGSRVDTGYTSGLTRYRNSFMFIGRKREQSYGVHLMAQGDTIIKSNPAINELLNDEYNETELEKASAYRYIWKENEVVGWNLPRHSISFVNDKWFYQDSNINNLVVGPWRGRYPVFAHGKYYIGDRTTGNIGILSNAETEYTDKVEFEIKTFARNAKGSRFPVKAIELDVLTGQNDSKIGLALSRDGREDSDFHYRSLKASGNYNHRVRWGGGLGRYDSFCGIKFRGTGDVSISVEGADIS